MRAAVRWAAMTRYVSRWACLACQIYQPGEPDAVNRAAEKHTKETKHATVAGMLAAGVPDPARKPVEQ